jgi:hypothetical protein
MHCDVEVEGWGRSGHTIAHMTSINQSGSAAQQPTETHNPDRPTKYQSLVALVFQDSHAQQRFVTALDDMATVTVTSASPFPHEVGVGAVLHVVYEARGANRNDMPKRLARATAVSGVEPVTVKDVVGLIVKVERSIETDAVHTETPIEFEALLRTATEEAEKNPGAGTRLFLDRERPVRFAAGPGRTNPGSTESRDVLITEMLDEAARHFRLHSSPASCNALVFLSYLGADPLVVLHAWDSQHSVTQQAPVKQPLPQAHADWQVGDWVTVDDGGRFDGLHRS